LLVIGNVRLVAICADAGVGQCSRIAVVREGLAAANPAAGIELSAAPVLTRRQWNTVGINGVLAFSVVASLASLGTGLVDRASSLWARRALGAGRSLGTDEASEGRGGDEEGGVKHVVAETSD